MKAVSIIGISLSGASILMAAAGLAISIVGLVKND